MNGALNVNSVLFNFQDIFTLLDSDSEKTSELMGSMWFKNPNPACGNQMSGIWAFKWDPDDLKSSNLLFWMTFSCLLNL
jgi:hypothetical protein